MAEFLNQSKPTRLNTSPNTGFNAMGKPIPYERRAEANQHLIAMGLDNVEDRHRCIEQVVHSLERDDIYEAMKKGMQYVDLIGVYRLFAVLLSEPEGFRA